MFVEERDESDGDAGEHGLRLGHEGALQIGSGWFDAGAHRAAPRARPGGRVAWAAVTGTRSDAEVAALRARPFGGNSSHAGHSVVARHEAASGGRWARSKRRARRPGLQEGDREEGDHEPPLVLVDPIEEQSATGPRTAWPPTQTTDQLGNADARGRRRTPGRMRRYPTSVHTMLLPGMRTTSSQPASIDHAPSIGTSPASGRRTGAPPSAGPRRPSRDRGRTAAPRPRTAG